MTFNKNGITIYAKYGLQQNSHDAPRLQDVFLTQKMDNGHRWWDIVLYIFFLSGEQIKLTNV